MEFATIIGEDFTEKPYTSQRNTPMVKIMNVAREMLSVERVLQAFST
jgi:hypothetical protein